jgi:hypothetical protein
VALKEGGHQAILGDLCDKGENMGFAIPVIGPDPLLIRGKGI